MLEDRIPPQAIDIERTVLGSMMASELTIEKAFDLINESCFYSGANKRVFAAMKELFDTEKPIDIITITDFLNRKGTLDVMGGEAYIAELAEAIATAGNIEYYCRILLDREARRRLITISYTMTAEAFNTDTPLSKLAGQTDELSQIMNDAAEGQGEAKDRARIVDPLELMDNMVNYSTKSPVNKGEDTGWWTLNEHYKPARGTLNIVTGIPTHGKSEFMDALAMNLSAGAEWRWLFFSPENHPTEIHLRKLIEKRLGKNLTACSQDDIRIAMEWIGRYFKFVSLAEDSHNLDSLLRLIRAPVKEDQFDAVLIDPWNELDVKIDHDESETDRIGRQLSRLRRYGRRNNIAVFIVAHPAKMMKNKITGVYDVPTLYDISGSAHWYNRADNGICIYRQADKETGILRDEVDVYVQKIKFKVHGSQGLVHLTYERESGRFYEDAQKSSQFPA